MDLTSGELVILWAVSAVGVGPFGLACILGLYVAGSVGTFLVAFAVGEGRCDERFLETLGHDAEAS